LALLLSSELIPILLNCKLAAEQFAKEIEGIDHGKELGAMHETGKHEISARFDNMRKPEEWSDATRGSSPTN
jgi:hypothetical protein